MRAVDMALTITEELQASLRTVDNQKAAELAERISSARRIFLTGAGRSLLMVKCCAMRLMQIGLTVYVPGETTTPAIGPGDLLIAVSGSGETGTVALMVKKARDYGAEIALITMVPDSTMGGLSDLVLTIEASSTKVSGGKGKASIQLGGSQFELSVLILLETIVMLVVERLQIQKPNELLMQNHANME